ncbi:kinase-like protein [Xylaria cubensis]|nr:kinase-like protein [Xylaria cubensis]
MPGSHINPDNTVVQHEGITHIAINNTLFRRCFTLLALKTIARFRSYKGPCMAISKHLIVKTGPFVHLTEAATMAFVAAKTSIPVPRVYCSFVYRNRAFIMMERVQGRPLAEVWNSLSDTEQEHVLWQLRDMVQELRAIPPPSNARIESCVSGSLRDRRIPKSWPGFGPFKTVQDFHLWLREGLRPEEHPDRKSDQDWEDIKEMVAKQDGPWSPPVFTHADLNPSNILLRGSRVVAIIDWEFAGWYPNYWEYTSAWYGSIKRTAAWQILIARFLDPYPEELRMEITRQKWWGENLL